MLLNAVNRSACVDIRKKINMRRFTPRLVQLVALLAILSGGCATTYPQQSEYCFDTPEIARSIGQTVFAPLMQHMHLITQQTTGLGVFYGTVKDSNCGKGKGSVMLTYEPSVKHPLDDAQKKQIWDMGLEKFNDLMIQKLKNNPDLR